MNLPQVLTWKALMTSATPGDDHHDADDQYARDGRADDAAERDDSGDEIDDAEGDDPAPFGVQRRERRERSRNL